MKLIFKKEYNGDPDSLPHTHIKEGSVKFREIDDTTQASLLFNGICLIITLGLIVILGIKYGFMKLFDSYGFLLGIIFSMLVLFPHELLHAICFQEEVYLYTAWKKGMLFVMGLESMSKKRFIFMSLLPNIVFGFVPYCLAILFPSLYFLGGFGAICIGMGTGDYYNVFNALIQMPKNSYAYMHKMNTYWYLDDKN